MPRPDPARPPPARRGGGGGRLRSGLHSVAEAARDPEAADLVVERRRAGATRHPRRTAAVEVRSGRCHASRAAAGGRQPAAVRSRAGGRGRGKSAAIQLGRWARGWMLPGAVVGGARDWNAVPSPQRRAAARSWLGGGDHHHLGRPEAEERDRRLVRLGPRLVAARALGGEARSPMEARGAAPGAPIPAKLPFQKPAERMELRPEPPEAPLRDGVTGGETTTPG